MMTLGVANIGLERCCASVRELMKVRHAGTESHSPDRLYRNLCSRHGGNAALLRDRDGIPVIPQAKRSLGRVSDRIGSTTLALTVHGVRFDDTPPEHGALSLQLAFRVPPQVVANCAEALERKGVKLISPVTDHPFGHRTIFFRDPDGNILEIFAEI